MLLFIGVVQFGIGVVVAEALSPSYSVNTREISDLGKVFPDSARIFNPSIILSGLLVVGSAYFIQRAYRWKPGTVVITLAGVGQVGVGLFPEGTPYELHALFSLLTFVSIGLAAILMARWQRAPLSYLSVIMGGTSLVALLLYMADRVAWGATFGIGPGGLERMIVYPVLFWAVAYSGYLIGTDGAK